MAEYTCSSDATDICRVEDGPRWSTLGVRGGGGGLLVDV